HAVQALFQAMELNLPISAVADLYKLKVAPTPLSEVGATGRAQDATAGGLRLAGALTTDATVAARLLQHVVSSEILSLLKDEVSQSPAFSVIIDEAPLRKHNSLVAHVLLYLRYMRRDPQSASGELQVVTRFWRCVHLYLDSNGRLARRDPCSMVLGLLERGKIQTSRLVCIASERPADRPASVEEQRRPHLIHWHGLFAHPNSLSPQVYEEISGQSADFAAFAAALADLCLFVYSHPASFAFLGADHLETLFKTLCEAFLSEGTLQTRPTLSLTPSIVIAITRNISQIIATVRALSKLPRDAGRAVPVARQTSTPLSAATQGSGEHSTAQSSPRSPSHIPLALVDAMSLPNVRLGRRDTIGRCPPADQLFQQLRDYGFLGCLHFMADILLQVEPVIAAAGASDMPTRALGGAAADPSGGGSLDARLRKCLAAVKEAIESVTLMYGDENDESQDSAHGAGGDGEDGFSGLHLNEFLHLTGKGDGECTFRSFRVENHSPEHSAGRLVELIRTVSSAILKDLTARFTPANLATIQALADMWDPRQFPCDDRGSAMAFASGQAAAVAQRLSRAAQTDPEPGGLLLPQVQTAPITRTQSIAAFVDRDATIEEWRSFKHEVRQQLGSGARAGRAGGEPGEVQRAYSRLLFPVRRLAPSRRRLRTDSGEPASDNGVTRYPNLARLATAWNVLPLALSLDLHGFRGHYERQLRGICRDQAEAKLRPTGFDTDDSFTEIMRRQQQHATNKSSAYVLLRNSRIEAADSPTDAGEGGLEGPAAEQFLRILDAVTLALDHRLRLLSVRHTEAPLAVAPVPGACPKWMQNAMRGYWRLACRTPESSAGTTRRATPQPLRSAPLTIQRPQSPAAGAASGQGVRLDVGMRGSATTPLDGPGQPVHSAISGALLSLAATCGPPPLADTNTPVPAGLAADPAMTATAEEFGTIPLLEALLSGPAGPAAPPTRDGQQHRAVALDAPPAKRPRHSSVAIPANSNGLGLQHLGGILAPPLQQQPSSHSGGQDDFFLGAEIARLASDMGLDAASSQALAASLADGSRHALAGAGPMDSLRMDMPSIPPQQHPDPLSRDSQAFAAAFGGPAALPMSPAYGMPSMAQLLQRPFPAIPGLPPAHAPDGYPPRNHHNHQPLPDNGPH
ncbi:hypothetical protein IWQ56_002875, partial [Coemansia nantahalensis]